MSKHILSLFCCVTLFLSGMWCGYRVKEPVTITKKEIVYRTIERNYNEMPLTALQNELRCYDTAKPLLDISPIDERHFKIEAGLCKRSWSRDITVECASEGNWKLYLGIGIGVAGAAAITYGIYRLTK